MNARGWCMAVALLAAAGGGAQAQTALHGSADVFAAPGVILAWAVERGATESETRVVLRIDTRTAVFPVVGVVGIDPFTRQEKIWSAIAPSAGTLEVRIPRAQFGDFPRTEVRLYADAAATPALSVFYLGVPDTTPEFAESARLDAYLALRISRARATDPGKSP